MAISPVASSGATSNAQSLAIVAQAEAKAANQQALVNAQNQSQDENPVSQVPAAKPSVNSSGQAIGTTINVTA